MNNQNQYSITLDSMEFHAFHGCYALERRTGSHFVVNLRIDVQRNCVFEKDDVACTVNYVEAYDIVRDIMAVTRNTMECKAEEIINAVKKHFPSVTHVRCEIRKIAPPLGGKVGFAAVTLEG